MTLLDCPHTPLLLTSLQTAVGETLSVIGYLDTFTVPTLRATLLDAVQQRGHPKSGALTLDLSCVRFIDAAGVSLLLDLRAAVETQSRALTIRLRPGSQPETVFRASALSGLLTS